MAAGCVGAPMWDDTTQDMTAAVSLPEGLTCMTAVLLAGMLTIVHLTHMTSCKQ